MSHILRSLSYLGLTGALFFGFAAAPAMVFQPASSEISALVGLSAYGTEQSRDAVCDAAGRSPKSGGLPDAERCILTSLSPARTPLAVPSRASTPVGGPPNNAELIAALDDLTNLAAVVLNRHGQGKLPIGPD